MEKKEKWKRFRHLIRADAAQQPDRLSPRARRVLRVAVRTVRGYLGCQLPRSAAALSYFLILSIFPFLICLNGLLQFFHMDYPNLIAEVGRIFPDSVADFLAEYLNYVRTADSNAMLVAGVTMMVTSASAAFRTILNAVGNLYGQKRYKTAAGWLFSFLYAFLFLFAVYICIVVSVFGAALVGLLGKYLPVAAKLQQILWLRYPLIAAFMFLILFGLYALTAPRLHPRGTVTVWLGALLSALIVMGVGEVYSQLIRVSTKYSLVYGSLASVVVLLMWIYTCGCVILGGAAFNAARTAERRLRRA